MARQWLQQFKNDVRTIASLRLLLTEDYDIWRIGSMKEDAVIDQISNELSSGNLRVCPQMLHQSPAMSRATSIPEPLPFPLNERRSRASTVPASPSISDPPTFSSDVNPATQAAALVAAAVGGRPFCPQ
jgi:hypothetical protein